MSRPEEGRMGAWMRMTFANDLERQDFDAVRRKRSLEGVTAVGLVQVFILVLFWPTDLMLEAEVASQLGYFRAGVVGLWMLAWFTARSPLVRRYIQGIVVPYVVASAMAAVWLGPITSLDAAWVDVCVIVPMFCAVIVQQFGARVVSTVGVSVGFVALFFASRPDQLDNPHLGSFVTSLIVATLGSIAVGHIYTLLVHQQFTRSRALAQKNMQLESVIAERTSELVELTQRLHKLRDDERSAVELELSSRAREFMRSCRGELAQATTTNETVKGALERIAGLLDTLELQLQEALGGDDVDIDLPTRIGRAVATARPSTHSEIVCNADAAVGRLSAPARNALFRMFQEAFNNALKHSHAQRITVEMVREGARVVLTVADNGIGMDAARRGPNRGTGIGLESLQQRAVELGARLTIVSSESDGTRICIAYDTDMTALEGE